MRILLSSCLVLFISSCSFQNEQHNTDPKYVNSLAFRKAIKHYEKSKEQQKLNALMFIRDNYDGHFAHTNILSKKYDSLFSPAIYGGALPADERKFGLALDKLVTLEKIYGTIKSNFTKTKSDKTTLEAKFIIENIDIAFKVWKETPWSKNLSFEEFCEHILPYRVGQEPLNDWRKQGYKNFSWVMSETKSRLEACSIINDSLKNVLSNMIEMKMYPTALTYENMYKMKVGVCRDETAFATMAMRAVGLPVGIDFVPQWPWRSMNHSWNYLLLEYGSTVQFMGTESNPGVPHFENERKGKVYRQTFVKQTKSLALIEADHNQIPPFFRSPYFKDVTEHYVESHEIKIDINPEFKEKNEYAYLSVFNNRDWIPIDWSIIDEDQALFNNIEGGIVYMPTHYSFNKYQFAESPILVDNQGDVKTLNPNLERTQQLTLTRKYPLLKRMKNYLSLMRGGRFEVANRKDFQDAIIIGKLKQTPEPYLRTIENKTTDKKFKYLRYVSSDSGRCNMAILNFYGVENGNLFKLNGQIIGAAGSYKGFGAEKGSAFDSDPATFFDANETDWGNAWIGLKLERPVQVSHVDFMPRNDTNTIFEGNIYELFYWSDGWVSVGKKVGDKSEKIIFNHVPTEALYILKNHTAGTEERIFTYQEGSINWF